MAIRIAKGLGTDLPDLLGGFHGLTPEGLDAARLIEAIPPRARAALLAFLRANEAERKR